MDHVAIMKKSWGLLPKILKGEKSIESRWYQTKRAPWNKIQPDETVYFKNSGEPVTIKATVGQVFQFEHLNPAKVSQILDRYSAADGIDLEDEEKFKNLFSNKNYCLLIFLKKVQKVLPFEIDKIGFGMMSAWLSVTNIDQIRKKTI